MKCIQFENTPIQECRVKVTFTVYDYVLLRSLLLRIRRRMDFEREMLPHVDSTINSATRTWGFNLNAICACAYLPGTYSATIQTL